MAISIAVTACAFLAAADAGNTSSQAPRCHKTFVGSDEDAVMSLLQVHTLEGTAATAAAMVDVRDAIAATARLRRKYGQDIAKSTWHSALDQVTSAIGEIRQVQQHRQRAPVGAGPLPQGPLPPTNVLKASPEKFQPPSSQASMQQQNSNQESQVATKAAPEAKAGENATQTPVTGARIAPFGKEDTATELTKHAERTQDTLVDAVENAEVAEVKRAVFRALTRLRAASIKEFDTIARLETQAIDEYNDAHHYRAENPLNYMHSDEPPVPEDKYQSFH